MGDRTQTPVQRVTDDADEGHALTAASRRALLVGAGGAGMFLAGALAAPIADSAAPKSTRKGAAARRRAKKHRKVCRHFHRCAKHRKHTCRRRHACPHRFHKAPKKKPTSPTPGTPTPTKPTPSTPAAPPPLDAVLVARRFSYGPSSFPESAGGSLATAIAAAGGARAWFEQQLRPAEVADPFGDQIDTWWPHLTLPATEIGARNIAEVEPGWIAEANFQRWTIARRIHSTRQLHEVVSEFWENMLHVSVGADGTFPHRSDYGRTIRRHALGTFSELLHAAITHPAMGVHLNNGVSTRRAPNENLGRELLEIHTVGQGQYTEEDVKNSARILTGWRVAPWVPWTHHYDPESHWTGPVTVMGFSHANADRDGRAVTRAYLEYLALHPATARRVARRLAVRFVQEEPDAGYVQRIADVYLSNRSAIVPVLRFILDSPEFSASGGAGLVRTPTDDLVATCRALGAVLERPVSDSSGANQLLWISRTLGQAPFAWPRPDGQPIAASAWASPARMLGSCRFHWDLGNGWYPKNEAEGKPITAWMPAATATVGEFAVHVATTLLGRAPAAALVDACCTAIGLPFDAVLTLNGERITTPGRGNIAWELPVVLVTVLDSPAHMHR